MPKTVCIVQARMGSTRFLGKVLKPLNGHTVIGEVLERCKRIPGVDQVVCAIPHGDMALLIEAGRYCDTRPSAANENDVLTRYYTAAVAYQADIIVRVTGDCPLISPELCGEIVGKVKIGADYASNIEPRSFPKGLDCEAFTMTMLTVAHKTDRTPYGREHVTPWIRANAPNRVNVGCRWHIEGRLTLDTEDDYKVICAAFADAPNQHL